MANDNPLQATVRGRYVGGPIFEPKVEDGKARYYAIVVLEDGEEAKVKEICKAAAKAKWGDKLPEKFTVWGVQEGDRPSFTSTYGRNFINPKATETVPPKTLVKRNGAFVETNKREGIIYPGCDVAVSINAFAYEAKKNSPAGVTLGLRAILFRGDNEPLIDIIDADNEFGDIEVEEKDDFAGYDDKPAAAKDDDFFG